MTGNNVNQNITIEQIFDIINEDPQKAEILFILNKVKLFNNILNKWNSFSNPNKYFIVNNLTKEELKIIFTKLNIQNERIDLREFINNKIEKDVSIHINNKNDFSSELLNHHPKVFISYSWDNELHRIWVLKLASNLIKNGIDIIIDEWDLINFNNDLHQFMESGIRESDYVIMVCTPRYVTKANSRLDGVGVENTIITGEYYNNQAKYIPIIRNSTTEKDILLPTYLKSKFAINFNNDNKYNEKFDELIRLILKIPKYQKPTLGKIPKINTQRI